MLIFNLWLMGWVMDVTSESASLRRIVTRLAVYAASMNIRKNPNPKDTSLPWRVLAWCSLVPLKKPWAPIQIEKNRARVQLRESWKSEPESLLRDGLLERMATRWRLSERGLLLADSVFATFA